MQAFAASSSSSPPPPSSPASPAASAASPPATLTASALPLAPFGSPLPAVPLFVQLPSVSPSALLECLQLSASSDDSCRRAGSVRLRELSALSGYGACLLLLALSAGQVDDSLRLLAAIELKNSIAALFSNANKLNSAASVRHSH